MRQITLYNNGNLLSYAEYGDKNGYPILIQHGLIASINDHYLFKRLIGSGTHLICIARPGYGESSPNVMNCIGDWADIVSILIDELKLTHFDILGMSSGAPYSYSIGNKFPDKVRNIFIFSGMPALYDENIQSFWPYEVTKNANIAEMQKLAYKLFFSNIPKDNLAKDDIKDSMMYDCFGIAQELKLRCMDWGFRLSDVTAPVRMQHSRFDTAVPFITAEMTSKLLPNCVLVIKENDVHFSTEALDDFIRCVMLGHYEK